MLEIRVGDLNLNFCYTKTDKKKYFCIVISFEKMVKSGFKIRNTLFSICVRCVWIETVYFKDLKK